LRPARRHRTINDRTIREGTRTGSAFVYTERNGPDPKKARELYGELFDWNFSDAPGEMPYTLIDMGDGAGGGMMQAPQGAPSR